MNTHTPTTESSENLSDKERIQAELLDTAIEAMRNGTSPEHFLNTPEFQSAVHLHTATSHNEIAEPYKTELQNRLLKQFATKKSTEYSWFHRIRTYTSHSWFVPMTSVGLAAILLIAITQLPQNQSSFDTQSLSAQQSASSSSAPLDSTSQEIAQESEHSDSAEQNTLTQQPGENPSERSLLPTESEEESTESTPTQNTQNQENNNNNSLNVGIAEAGKNNQEQSSDSLKQTSIELTSALTTAEQDAQELAAYEEFASESEQHINTALTSLSSL